MRIIANKHDYYDPIQKQGQDRTIIYNRKESEIVYHKDPGQKWKDNYPFAKLYSSFAWGSHRNLYVEEFTIGFVGKIYPLIALGYRSGGPLTTISRIKLCYQLSEIDEYVKENLPAKDVDKFNDKKYNPIWSNGSRDIFVKFFEWHRQNHNKFDQYFVDNKSPIFVGMTSDHERVVKFNCLLKDFQFYRVFDAYSAFQEIQMWMSNQAVPLKPIPKISDKDMVTAKGFDKYSFRKDKSK
jgi:hypothetical protein